MQWRTIFAKEMSEDWRNFKWVWVPLVFILIAIMDPITTYFLPKILDSVGGMPDGAVFEMPEVSPVDAIMMSLTELSMFGVLVTVVISMGVISGERKSGVAELVLVKPVGYFTYISSKWAGKLLLVLTSYIIGMLVSWYYVNILFGEITFSDFMSLLFFYGLWLVLVITITIFYNTLFKVPGVVGAVSIGTIIVMSILNQIFSHKLTWFPNSLSSHIGEMLTTGEISGDLWGTSVVIIILVIVLLVSSLFTFRGKEMAG
ncbi:ABC transporter permease [Aquibacillus koreensis]|uniref:ABC transporter permease n=1 Tax=Aquibacillus koreensis TaxID=279446 RepID=A0A9X3WQS5_9BACI|nr:ABC transporter permease [Aquibacillus koreensis]MCT2534402.1 ABC transporter permease [Aquibacillus koreensis]MDC3421709.1 ABC transporter permease [Aquibacillus koreensis]